MARGLASPLLLGVWLVGTKLVLDRLKETGVLGEDEVAFVDVCAEGQVACPGAPGGLAPFFPCKHL